ISGGRGSIGTRVITFSIRWLVSSYAMERVDQQLLEEADLVFPQMLKTDANPQHGFTSYYVKVYNTNTGSS
ncbi:two-component sensor histidine kinase, partial [Bifidobacterium animalis]|nr:two-component sensor histidine kinase [Bifidobacterium animalis]